MSTNPSEPRKAIHAIVPRSSYEAWHTFAGSDGPNVSAILAAAGVRLAGGERFLDMTQVIEEARKIDTANRRRQRSAA